MAQPQAQQQSNNIWDEVQAPNAAPVAGSNTPSAAPSTPTSGTGLWDETPNTNVPSNVPPPTHYTNEPTPSPYSWLERQEGKLLSYVPFGQDNKVLGWVNTHVAQPPVVMGREVGNIAVQKVLGEVGREAHVDAHGNQEQVPDYAKGNEEAYWRMRYEQENPRVAGVIASVADTAGNLIGNPTNWPLMGAAAGKSAMMKVFTKVFGYQMALQAKDEIASLVENGKDMSPEQFWRKMADVATHIYFTKQSLSHGGAGPKKEGPENAPTERVVGEKSTAKTIAGQRIPVTAQHAAAVEGVQNAPVENATAGDLHKINEFQRTQTKPAAQQAMHSLIGQTAEDLINNHDSIVNGEEPQEPKAGTQTPSKFQSIDAAAQGLFDKAQETTYSKADEISEREQNEWQDEVKRAHESNRAAVQHYNDLVADHNANLQPGEQPMEPMEFDPSKTDLPERPKTYSEVRAAVKRAQADLNSGTVPDAAENLDKAQKNLDQWFKQRSDEISPEEYSSAKKMWYTAERFQEIGNRVRGAIANDKVTGNTLRNAVTAMDNQAIRRGEAPGAFRRLVGDRVADNWRDLSRLFDPIKGAPVDNWGRFTKAFIIHHMLSPLGIGTGAATHFLMNRILGSPEWGDWFRDVADNLKDKVATGKEVSQPLLDRFKDLWQGERGSAEIPFTGKMGNIFDQPPTKPSTPSESADSYNLRRGGQPVQSVTPEAHPQGQDIADAFEKMQHNPSDPKTAASYEALRSEVDQQWDHAEKDGFKFEPWTKEGQPYANSREMKADVDNNKHLYFFRGGDIPADHPLAAVDPKTGLTYNDKLRAVHDLYGHAAGGYEFGPKGEEAAYKTHAQMFSSEAIPALTTETRGQNNWVNNGPHMRNAEGDLIKKGEPGYLSPTERPFAQQKVGLLPEKFQEGSATEKLIQKYGTTNDPLKAGFILPEGDMIPLTGEHDRMLGGKPTDNLREDFIKQSGAIRTRYRMSRAGEEQVFSLPLEITESQSRQIQNAASKIGKFGQIVLETVDAKNHKTVEQPTGLSARRALESLVTIKPENSVVDQTKPPISEYQNRGNGVHEVTTKDETGDPKGYLLARDVDNNPDAVRIKSHRAWEAGKGIGSSQIETLARELARQGKTTLLSDTEMTDSAKRPWEKLMAQYPEAITKTEHGYIFDLNDLGPAGAPEAEVTALPTPEKNLDDSEIATRRPTSTRVTPTNAPGQYSDMAGVEQASQAQPGGNGKMGYAEKLARTVQQYSGLNFTPEELKNPRAVIEKFVKRMTDNLVALHDAIPESMRETARRWYDTAHVMAKNMAEKYDVSHEQAAGVLASLSPQNAWDNNVALADRLFDTYKNRQNFEFSPKMEAAVAKIKGGQLSKAALGILKDIHGKTLSEIAQQPMPERLRKKWGADADQKWENVKAAQQGMWVRLYDEAHNSPENPMFHPSGEVVGISPSNRSWIGLDHVAKAIRIINDGSVENINNVMGDGNKIRNFYNNIINPNSKNGHVTVDTHAVGAAHFQPFSGDDAEVQHNFGNSPKGIPGAPKHAATGMRGTYPLYAEAYRRAAERLGVQPRELQSMTWEGIRSLMGDEKKTPELKSFARDIWQKVQDRELTTKQAREMIIEKAGGFSKPSWMTEEQWDEALGTGFNPEEFNTTTSWKPEGLERGIDREDAKTVDIPLSELDVPSKAFDRAQTNRLRGRGSKTEGPIEVFHNTETGQNLVEDGMHRLAEAFAKGKKSISAKIRSASYSDTVANVRPEDRFPLGGQK